MIAFHFPPIKGSSGIQRTLKFSAYLLNHGWKAHVLTVNPRAYEQVDDGQIKEIPEEVIVKRAFVLFLTVERPMSLAAKPSKPTRTITT